MKKFYSILLIVGFEIKRFFKKLKPYLTWTMFPAFFLAWLVTNGWAYILAAIGTGWIRGIAATYLGLLWLPFTPEKLITIPLAIWFQKLITDFLYFIKYSRVYKEKELPRLYRRGGLNEINS